MDKTLPMQMARLSLIAVWLMTAAVSVIDPAGVGHALLTQAKWVPTACHNGLIWLGAAVDLGIGLWMWLNPGRTAYQAAGVMTIAMTLVATAMSPMLWWHPLGPLSKNLPILALLGLLITQEP